ncbi:hypothetical protein G6F42_027167 [Rhizopus arrhizus]|nr:hypothetical protein G6F42_027167 [Rhizopus arrhizus]
MDHVISDEARYHRHSSEYKPDTGSIPSRRGTNKNSSHVALEQTVDAASASSLHSTPEPLVHPVAAPKSPRPPAQQISRDEGYSSTTQSMYAPTAAVMQQQHQQPSPNMMQQTLPAEQNTGYAPQPNPAYMGQHYQQQQHFMATAITTHAASEVSLDAAHKLAHDATHAFAHDAANALSYDATYPFSHDATKRHAAASHHYSY